MIEKVLLDTDFVQVVIVAELKLGKIIWKRKPETIEYRSAFQTLLQYAAKDELSNFISDIRNQGVVSPDDRKWFEREMLPAAINGGLKRAAVVFDGNIFKKYYLNLIMGASNKFGLPIKVFLSDEEALTWIDKCMEKEPA